MLESLFSKVAGLKASKFIKKRLQHRFFPVNIAKFWRTACFIEYLRWPLLTRNKRLSIIMWDQKGTLGRNGLIFNSLIQSQLKYCPLIWRFGNKMDIKKIDLKKFLKFMTVPCVYFWIKTKLTLKNIFISPATYPQTKNAWTFQDLGVHISQWLVWSS